MASRKTAPPMTLCHVSSTISLFNQLQQISFSLFSMRICPAGDKMLLLKTFQEGANKTSLNKQNTNHLFKLMNLCQTMRFIRLWGGESKFVAP